MAFPIRVHELRIRMQNKDAGFDLVLDPEAIRTLVVYWRETTESGIQEGADLSADYFSPADLAPVRGVREVTAVVRDGSASAELLAKLPVPCWHDDTCRWHCLSRLRDGFVAVHVTCVYSVGRGGYRTTVDAGFADRIVYRNFGAEDATFKLPGRVVEVRPAAELKPGQDGVISHERQETAMSAAGELTWHDPRCIWHEPE